MISPSYHQVFLFNLFIGFKFSKGPFKTDAPVVDDVDPADQFHGRLDILLRKEDADACLPQLEDLLFQIPDDQWSETLGGLIQQEKLGTAHQGPADREHLLLAAAQVSGPAGLDLFKGWKEIVDTPLVPVLVSPERNLEIVIDREIGKDPPIVGDIGDALPHEEIGLLPRNRFSMEGNGPLSRRGESPMLLMVVLFPAPFRPRSPTISP